MCDENALSLRGSTSRVTEGKKLACLSYQRLMATVTVDSDRFPEKPIDGWFRPSYRIEDRFELYRRFPSRKQIHRRRNWCVSGGAGLPQDLVKPLAHQFGQQLGVFRRVDCVALEQATQRILEPIRDVGAG